MSISLNWKNPKMRSRALSRAVLPYYSPFTEAHFYPQVFKNLQDVSVGTISSFHSHPNILRLILP